MLHALSYALQWDTFPQNWHKKGADDDVFVLFPVNIFLTFGALLLTFKWMTFGSLKNGGAVVGDSTHLYTDANCFLNKYLDECLKTVTMPDNFHDCAITDAGVYIALCSFCIHLFRNWKSHSNHWIHCERRRTCVHS